MNEYSDFRSDTTTHPTPQMRKAMAEAVVGDDVIGFDPTVEKLEAMAAGMFGKEAGLYVPTGTMANSIAVKVWTTELEEVIVEERAHIYNMESTIITFISRVTPRPVPSNRGAMDPALVESFIRKPSVSNPRTSLICVENTHNHWGGAVVPFDNLKAIRAVADKHDVKIHFDGARVFNASVASGVPVKQYGEIGDSITFCLSKGLSAPIGSVIMGSKDFIAQARRVRKALGGGMRQVGVIAAPGIVALTEMCDRLKEDHARAKTIALAIAELPGIGLNPDHVESNIIIFEFAHPKLTKQDFLDKLKENGILASSPKYGIRVVTHHDIDDDDVDKLISAFKKILL